MVLVYHPPMRSGSGEIRSGFLPLLNNAFRPYIGCSGYAFSARPGRPVPGGRVDEIKSLARATPAPAPARTNQVSSLGRSPQ